MHTVLPADYTDCTGLTCICQSVAASRLFCRIWSLCVFLALWGAQVGYGLWLGPESWPHLCPHGYAQHLADIDESCEINYCVIAHAFDQPTALLLNRPPYGKQPPNEGNVSYLLTVTESVDGRAWFRNDTNMTWQEFHVRTSIIATALHLLVVVVVELVSGNAHYFTGAL